MLSGDRRTFLKTSTVAATAGLTGLAGCMGGTDEDTLRFNFVVPVENIGSMLDIPEIQDELDNLGEEYELEVSQDASTPDSITAIAGGEADMALVTTESYGNAIANEAVPGGMTAIATDFWDAHPDHFGFEVYSEPDSDITEPEDLEGADLGVNATGTGIHAVYVKMLTELGLDPDDDVTYQEQGFATFLEGMEDDIIDVGIFPGLYAVAPRNQGYTEVFSSQDAFEEEYPFAYVVAGNDALDDKEPAIEAWMEDYVGVINHIYNNIPEVSELAADHFELDEDEVEEFLSAHDFYRDFGIDTGPMQNIMDELDELDLIEDSFDVDEYATNEYIEPHLDQLDI